MVFRLKRTETLDDGIVRVVRRQLESAVTRLRSPDHPDLVAHDVRVRLKRVRAALRLIRGPLGEDEFRRLNYLFRDAARPLTEVRDADVLVETFDSVLERFPGLRKNEYRCVRKRLTTNRKAMAKRFSAHSSAFEPIVAAIEPKIARATRWQVPADSWRSGLVRIYEAGVRAYAAARACPSPESLHEWRKQAKYLWNALRLLTPARIEDPDQVCNRARLLSRLLGEHHDLTVLSRTFEADPLSFGGRTLLAPLLSHIDTRRATIESRTFELGSSVFPESPGEFITRVHPVKSAGSR